MTMFKGIVPLLSPGLLKVLCEMGHGDEVVFANANFTAETPGHAKPVIRLPGVGLQRACAALLSMFPPDAAAARMTVCDAPLGFLSAVQQSVLT
jgi:L-fucose mutarotase